MNTKTKAKQPPLQQSISGYSPEQEADVVAFYPPADPTPEDEALVVDVVALDHRSLRRLGVKSQERQEIKRLLWNAVNAAFNGGWTKEGRLLYEKAEQAYYDSIQIRNRLRYLSGMIIGTAFAGALGGVLAPVAPSLEPYVPTKLLALLLVFAGLGCYEYLH